ncbi:hypothetical protein [Streptomyces subrutilus]|uniref:hypothetical protein n=1 Tax=Streptomyces subrutilus TaxID=36818 RepID=UPI0033D79811
MRTGPRAAALLALCTAAVAAAGLTGCGGPPRDGYVAVGAAAPGPERGTGRNVPPGGPVEFQRLGGPDPAAGPSASARPAGVGPPDGSAPGPAPGGDSARPGAGAPSNTSARPGAAGGSGTPGGPPSTGTGGSGTGGSAAGGGSGTGGSGGPGPGTPSGTTPPAPPPPATPARLTLSPPARSAAADRWCERVTVTFTNTGTTAARSGTVRFATHVIGALGVDWATLTTSRPLPAPLAGGTSKTQAYTVCLESWRVPLGMHVETREATATWN